MTKIYRYAILVEKCMTFTLLSGLKGSNYVYYTKTWKNVQFEKVGNWQIVYISGNIYVRKTTYQHIFLIYIANEGRYIINIVCVPWLFLFLRYNNKRGNTSMCFRIYILAVSWRRMSVHTQDPHFEQIVLNICYTN